MSQPASSLAGVGGPRCWTTLLDHGCSFGLRVRAGGRSPCCVSRRGREGAGEVPAARCSTGHGPRTTSLRVHESTSTPTINTQHQPDLANNDCDCDLDCGYDCDYDHDCDYDYDDDDSTQNTTCMVAHHITPP
ncbi:hypothetical protein E4U55_001274 [Claviceps digitariae]|nr:hypothetical protein E4U55_001274 [Claviceps digitariae]